MCVSPPPISWLIFGVRVTMERMCDSTKCFSNGRGGTAASYHDDITAREAGLGSKIASDCWLVLWLKRRVIMLPLTNSSSVLFMIIVHFLIFLSQAFAIPFIFIHEIIIVILIIVFFTILSPYTSFFLLPLHVLLL